MIDVHIPPVYQYPDNFCKQHPDSVAEDKQDTDTLAQRLQQTREEAHLRQTELAERAGLFSSAAIRNLLTHLTESCLMASLTHAEQRKKSAAL